MQHKFITGIFIAAFALLGCDEKTAQVTDKTPSNTASSSNSEPKSSVKENEDDDAWDEKVQAYIEVNNAVLEFDDYANDVLAEQGDKAEEAAAKGDFKLIKNSILLDGDATKMRAILSMPGKTPQADAAAQKLADALETYGPNWKALIDYNKAKKYEDDKGAKGKEMLPQYIKGLEEIRAAADELRAAVDVLAKEVNEKILANYKAEGLLLEVHTLEALGAAQKIVDTFEQEDDFKNPQKIKEANEQLAIMETSIEGMRAEHAKRREAKEKADVKDKQNILPAMDSYDAIASSLVELGGVYREARNNPQTFGNIVRKYNRAIDNYNRMN